MYCKPKSWDVPLTSWLHLPHLDQIQRTLSSDCVLFEQFFPYSPLLRLCSVYALLYRSSLLQVSNDLLSWNPEWPSLFFCDLLLLLILLACAAFIQARFSRSVHKSIELRRPVEGVLFWCPLYSESNQYPGNKIIINPALKTSTQIQVEPPEIEQRTWHALQPRQHNWNPVFIGRARAFLLRMFYVENIYPGVLVPGSFSRGFLQCLPGMNTKGHGK